MKQIEKDCLIATKEFMNKVNLPTHLRAYAREIFQAGFYEGSSNTIQAHSEDLKVLHAKC